MSRRRRIERLEAYRPVEFVPVDLTGWRDAIMADCDAHEAGRPHSIVPSKMPAQPRSIILDTMLKQARKVRADPEFPEWETACERRLAATVRAIERENAERERADWA